MFIFKRKQTAENKQTAKNKQTADPSLGSKGKLTRVNKQVEGQARSDPTAEDWEEDFISVLVGSKRPEGKPDGVTIYCLAERRWLLIVFCFYRVTKSSCHNFHLP